LWLIHTTDLELLSWCSFNFIKKSSAFQFSSRKELITTCEPSHAFASERNYTRVYGVKKDPGKMTLCLYNKKQKEKNLCFSMKRNKNKQ
jgi:hypothetical protein